MKLSKTRVTLFSAFSCLLLTACGGPKEVNDYTMVLSNDNSSYEGLFSGTIENNKPTGKGKFVSNDGWTIEGTFDESGFTGNIENANVKIKCEETEFEGSYEGEIVNNVLDGSGKFVSNDELEFTGSFSEGSFADGTVKDMKYSFVYQENTYEGIYNGEVNAMVPNGTGKYKGVNEENNIEYDGEWASGELEKGKLIADAFLVSFEDVDIIGQYEGEIEKGVACGEGTFSAVNSDKVPYVYNGQWKDGLWDGKGTQKMDDETYCVMKGTFEKGEFKPSKSEWISSYGDVPSKDIFSYNVTESAKEFIDKNEKLFPVTDIEEVSELVNNDITYKQMMKDIDSYSSDLIKISKRRVVQIDVSKDFWGKDISRVILDNSSYTGTYVVIYWGDSSDIYEGDKVECIGLPIAQTSYKNISGGYTRCIVLLGSIIK